MARRQTGLPRTAEGSRQGSPGVERRSLPGNATYLNAESVDGCLVADSVGEVGDNNYLGRPFDRGALMMALEGVVAEKVGAQELEGAARGAGGPLVSRYQVP